MTPAEIGIVYNQLVSQRAIYSTKIPNRRRTKEEVEASEILERSRGDHADLDDFLETQGLMLKKVDPFAMGLGTEGSIYVVLRNPSTTPPAHLTPSDVLQELVDERRRNETKDSAAVWASFMLLTLFYFLYTNEGRSISSVSQFKNTSVDYDQFVDEIRSRVEKIRNAGVGDGDNERKAFVYSTLSEVKDSNLETRANSFFSAMVKLKVLEKTEFTVKNSGTAVYRQSLWSALDTAENFFRHAGPVLANGLIGSGDIDAVLTASLPEQDEPHTEGEDA